MNQSRSRTAKRSFYGNSVQALHNETATAPLEISDEEASSTLDHPTEDASVKRLLPSRDQEPPQSQLLARPLGGLIGRRKKNEPPPVLVPDPEEEYKRKKSPFMTLEPKNTLSEPRSSSRLPRPIQRLARSTYPAQNDSRLRSNGRYTNSYATPNKKQRTGPSPMDEIQGNPVDSRIPGSADDSDNNEIEAIYSAASLGPIHGNPPSPPMQEPALLSRDESPDPLQEPVKALRSRKNSTRINKTSMSEKMRKSDVNTSMFAIKDIAGFFVPRKHNYYHLYVDHGKKDFWINVANPTLDTDPITPCRPVSRIIKFCYGQTGSKLRVMLSSSHNERENDFLVELESHKKVCELINLINSLTSPVEVKPQDDEKLDKIFNHRIKQGHHLSFPPTDHADMAYTAPSNSTTLDGLDQAGARDQRVSEASKDKIDFSSLSEAITRNRKTVTGSSEVSTKTRKPTAATDLLSEYFSPRTTRSTRSTTQLEPKATRNRSPAVSIPLSKRVELGPEWSHPLAYPKESKKREIVEYSDILRLDGDQFLNDSLINFFIRYLQHQLELHNPDLLKKMHFFNTYFFDTLTKNSKTRKDVNHAGVARWTKNIDIFSRDFVIVPVNDNLHWYLAIICNLSTFTKMRRHHEDDEEFDSADERAVTSTDLLEEDRSRDNTEDQALDQLQPVYEARQSFQELTLHDSTPDSQKAIQPVSPSAENSPHSAAARKSPSKLQSRRGRKSKIRKSLPKYDPGLPIIITLDSLGQSRGLAISCLKQYVVLEAKDKKNLEIDRDDLKGMTAKGIPSQNNYSDCGLYMCMYLEQFVADPYGFVKKILQREDAHLRWPKRIQSEELRSRLAQLILDLHHQQEGSEPKAEVPPLGSIMVELRKPSPDFILDTPPPRSEELGPSSLHAAHEGPTKLVDTLQCQDHDSRPNQYRLDDHGDRIISQQDIRPAPSPSQKQVRDEIEQARKLIDRVPSNAHDPIVLDDSPTRVERQLKPSPQLSSPTNLFKPRVHVRWDDNDDPIIDEQHSVSPDRSVQTRRDPLHSTVGGLRASHTVNPTDDTSGHVIREFFVIADSIEGGDSEQTAANRTRRPPAIRREIRESSEPFEDLLARDQNN